MIVAWNKVQGQIGREKKNEDVRRLKKRNVDNMP